MEKLHGFKNGLDGKTICIEKLFAWKNYTKKLLIFKNCFKHPRKRNHKKYGIGSFHIHVQYLYTKGNYKMVAQKL
jgi:hypothetical protein